MPQAIPIIAGVAGLAGAGYSAYSSRQQGKTAEALAQYNAHQQTLNAQMQLIAAQAQAQLQKRIAEANYRLKQSEANAKFANAVAIERTAEANSGVVREEIRRKSREQERLQGTQRAVIAASGIAESTGTPLDILAETAAQIQLERDDALYTDELNRRSLFREADLERLGGRLALAGATLDRSSALAEAGLNSAIGRAQYQRGLREAEITRLTGSAQKQSYYAKGTESLLSGVVSSFGSFAR